MWIGRASLVALAMTAWCTTSSHGGPQSVAQTIETFGRQTSRVTYTFGACTWSRMDCSCFVQRLFAEKFGRFLPRSTLTQVSSMPGSRVRSIGQSDQLNDRNLCAGDLIYTYTRGTWDSGSRHVVVYMGGDRVLHSSRKNNGVDQDSLGWVRKYPLRGVYRPLGCPDESRRPQGVPPPAPPPRTTSKGAMESVRQFIARYFENWETRDLDEYRRLWSPRAVRWSMGRRQSLQAIFERRRKELGTLVSARQQHEITGLGVWGDDALVDAVYTLNLTYARHRREYEDLKESFVLRRTGGRWQIVHNESFLGN